MSTITTVYILYNPISTGPAKKHAEELQSNLREMSEINCELVKTQHAGHAIELGKHYAAPRVMIVSSSGDGGFHELINGVLASDAAKQTVVGVLPSGNANDHHSARHDGDTAERIINGDAKTMDVLKVSWNHTTLYAHSYAGLGITAEIGETLTKKRPNLLTEPWLVLTGLIKRHPVRIIINGRKRRYDSFIMNLIGKMSKYLSTGEKNRPADGTFDLAVQRHTSLNGLFRHLLRHAATDDIKDASTKQSLSFTTTHATQIQLDGEVYDIPTHTTVSVSCIAGALRCII